MPQTPISYRGWTIHPGDPTRIQPPGLEILPKTYESVRYAKSAISQAIAFATRPAPQPPETEHTMPYRGWIIHIARNPRRVTRPDWIRIQPPGCAILPERYRKLQHAKQAIINAQKSADSSPHGTVACAEPDEPLG